MNREQHSQPGPRKEQGDAEGSRLHPPHAAEAGDAASVDQEPVLPATAHGTDRQPNEEHQDRDIDPASMYDRRPGEHKDRDLEDMP